MHIEGGGKGAWDKWEGEKEEETDPQTLIETIFDFLSYT